MRIVPIWVRRWRSDSRAETTRYDVLYTYGKDWASFAVTATEVGSIHGTFDASRRGASTRCVAQGMRRS